MGWAAFKILPYRKCLQQAVEKAMQVKLQYTTIRSCTISFILTNYIQENRKHWVIFRVFKVFSEHLQVKKKIKKSVLGHSLTINAKNSLYLFRLPMQRIYLLPNDSCLGLNHDCRLFKKTRS